MANLNLTEDDLRALVEHARGEATIARSLYLLKEYDRSSIILTKLVDDLTGLMPHMHNDTMNISATLKKVGIKP
jgi:hypothetical protein